MSRIGAFAIVELQKLQHDRTELLTRMVQPALWLLIFGTTFSGPGFETALDAFTGGLVWDAPDAASSLSPVGIVNGLVFAGENLGAFKARDVSNGLPLFTFNAGGPIASGPVIADGMVFVGVGVLPGSGETEGLYAFAP